MSLGFRIGGREHEYARVEVIGADGDGWLPSRIGVRAGGFQGTFPCDLDRWAFARFAREVRDMHRTLKGTAAFTTYEGQLELALAGDGLGHVHIEAAAMDYEGTGKRLTFGLHIDQTELPALLRDLDAIVSAYPPPNTSVERALGR